MSDAAAAADAILERLPSLSRTQRRLELLTGGLTNRNYLVSLASGERFVARFSDPKSALLAIDRDAEYRNSEVAAQAGVGPEVVEYAPEQRVLLVKWINGRTFADPDLDNATQLDRIARLCRQLHSGPRFVRDFDMFDVQRGYLAIVREHGFRLPDDYLTFEPAMQRVEGVLRASAVGTVPCHNDLLAANIMDDGARLWFIDYEYAGNNDACFDLGNIWSEAALDVDRLEHLVNGYFGAPSPVHVARARLFGLAAKYGWTLWAAIQDGVSDVDFDFWEWGMEKYVRARDEFRSPELNQLISTIEESI
ncbi:MAG TPA: choline/ethanolamine kinase family protein [Jatrophihabitans sp.]|nr:choline/ethanolamine kinase family protein [Jatrophihabitans sp.]